MHVWNVLHASRWKYRVQKLRKKVTICAPSHNFVGLYLRNWCIYRQSEKNLFNSNISSTCPHSMMNDGSLTAEIGLLVWGTPAKNIMWKSHKSLTGGCVTIILAEHLLCVSIFDSTQPTKGKKSKPTQPNPTQPHFWTDVYTQPIGSAKLWRHYVLANWKRL